MTRFNARRAPLLLAVAILVVGLLGREASLWLQYDRQAILAGQVWRLVTGHLAHLGMGHLLLNLAGLALVWALVGSALPTARCLAVSLICALGVSLGLLLFDPAVQRYVGFSGVLHGLFAAGAMGRLRVGMQGAWPMLGVLALKLAWEQIAGPLPGSAAAAGGAVIVNAHLYGALTGLLTAWLPPVKTRYLD
jgi:rhomboid family GlyGly-CTERM serine protease